jgi:hypothetical protein
MSTGIFLARMYEERGSDALAGAPVLMGSAVAFSLAKTPAERTLLWTS